MLLTSSSLHARRGLIPRQPQKCCALQAALARASLAATASIAATHIRGAASMLHGHPHSSVYTPSRPRALSTGRALYDASAAASHYTCRVQRAASAHRERTAQPDKVSEIRLLAQS